MKQFLLLFFVLATNLFYAHQSYAKSTVNTLTTKNSIVNFTTCSQTITGEIYNRNKKLVTCTISLFLNGKLLERIESNKFNFKLNCNENYEITIEATNYATAIIEVTTDAKNNDVIQVFPTLIDESCHQILVGTIKSNSATPLKIATLQLYENGILRHKLTATNAYQFNINCNSSYKLVAVAENFESYANEFLTTANYNEKVEKNITLTPILCQQQLVVSVKNSKTNDFLKGAIVDVFEENNLVKSFNLVKDSIFNLNVYCEKNYTFKTKLEKFESQIITYNSLKTENKSAKTILLKPTSDIIPNKDKLFIVNSNSLYFDLNKYEIKPESSVELNNVVAYMLQNPMSKIEINSHTDSRAPDAYNLYLSKKRAESVVDFIISKGIDSARVSGKGYGETQLVNNCVNGTKCTEAEHLKNRRTEFILTEN